MSNFIDRAPMLTRARKLAHISDLHFGRSAESDARATRLCRALIDARIDHVVVTGDLTHRGRRRELARQRFPIGDAAGELEVERAAEGGFHALILAPGRLQTYAPRRHASCSLHPGIR